MTDLKPCPFCGYKGVEILADDNKYLYYRYFSQCQRCGAGAKRGHTKEDAVKEWNRRAEMVHGRWVTHYRSGTTVAEGYVSTCCDMWNNRKSDYCPHCGAKMDGGADHEAD